MTQDLVTLPLLFSKTLLTVAKLKQVIVSPTSNEQIFSQTITRDEISIIASKQFLAKHHALIIEQEEDWQAIKIDQELEFNMLGVIAKISQILAASKISIFVLSTFNTDYILVKQQRMKEALAALEENHFSITMT